MSACGAAGAASTKVLTQLQDENEKLMETAKDYRNPDIVIPDSRSEMADILDAVRGKLMNDLAKTLSDSVKINAWQFNQLLLSVTKGAAHMLPYTIFAYFCHTP